MRHPFVYWSGFVVSFSGFLQNYAACVIAGALLFIDPEFKLTPTDDGLVAAMILLGAVGGSIISGSLADRFGRRSALLCSTLLFILSNAAILFISSLSALLLIRFITGIGVGIASITAPLYLAEIAPPKLRGAFVSSFQLAITIGTFVAYLVNLLFAPSGNWRMMLFLTAVFSVFQAIALFFIPETPRWLFASGKKEKGEAVLKALHLEETMTSRDKKLSHGQWSSLLSPLFRRALWIGVALTALQQWCGINAVVYFAPKIFQVTGFAAPEKAILVSLGLGLINLLATFFPLFFIDRLGRRTLLLISQVGVSIGLILFTSLFRFSEQPILSVVFLILYLVSFAIGLGPIPWVLIAEIYPLRIRAHAISLMLVVSWLSNFLIVFTFPKLLAFWGPFWTFASYTIIALMSIWCFKRIVPETKGKSLEEIERDLYEMSIK